MFGRKFDECETDPRSLYLLYIQAQYEYLLGNYPVVCEDAAQLCALQMCADCCPTKSCHPMSVSEAAEKYITKQVGIDSKQQYEVN